MHAPCNRPTRPSARVRRALLLAALPALAAVSASALQDAPTVRFDARSADRMVVAAADVNGDGSVSVEEREAFFAAHVPGADAVLDRDTFLALALTPYYDADGDRAFGAADVAALLARWDSDGDGAISAEERANGPVRRGLRDGVVLNALDADQDGAITAEEWAASASHDLAAWLGAAAAIPEDVNGFGPGTMVLTLRASLDADTNAEFKGDDVAAFFNALDANGDGAVSDAEFTPAPTAPPRVTNWAVTEEMRGRTPLMPWQRSLEDALALSQETGKPLLICVNTDGEAASDNLAFDRYRDPAFIELASGFIPLLASPQSHTDRAFDTRGSRIECTRFGRLLCSEHIEKEPVLYERYFNGQRIAPRHVGVAPDGTILFDLVLLQDLTIVDDALRAHGKFDVALPDAGALSVEELLASHDAAARTRLADRFRSEDVEGRLKLVARAASPTRPAVHAEVLTLGLYDGSALVRSAAAIRAVSAMSEDLLDFAPRIRWIAADDKTLRRDLAKSLAALAERTTDANKQIRARRLARLFGAAEGARSLDVPRWRIAGAGMAPSNTAADLNDVAALDAALGELDALLRADRHDPELNAMVAETTLRKALLAIQGIGGGNPQFSLQDAVAFAERSLDRAPAHAHARATLARAQYWLNQPAEAADNAALALHALGPKADSRLTGELLDVLAKARTSTLYPQLGTEEGWPAQWLTQVVDATLAQIAHADCTEAQAIAGASLFENLEDYANQAEYLRLAIQRFPASADLHSWLRWQVLRDGDGERSSAAALEHAYDDLDSPTVEPALWRWYVAVAQKVAAETYAQEGDAAASTAAYHAALEAFGQVAELNPDYAESVTASVEEIRTALADL